MLRGRAEGSGNLPGRPDRHHRREAQADEGHDLRQERRTHLDEERVKQWIE